MAPGRKPSIDVQSLKLAAAGRWKDILAAAGIPLPVLDGNHHPCPRCEGTDRFRFIDEADGAVLCNQCFNKANGDGIAAVMWFKGWGFSDAVRFIAEQLGHSPVRPTAESKPSLRKSFEEQMTLHPRLFYSLLDRFARSKTGITVPGLLRINVRTGSWPKGGKHSHTVIAFPAVSEPGGSIVGWTIFRLDGRPFPDNRGKPGPKDRNLAGSRDGWILGFTQEEYAEAHTVWRVEGPTDLAALIPLLPPGHVACTSLCGAGSARADVRFLKGKRVMAIGDADKPGIAGRDKFAGRAARAGADVWLIDLPYEVSQDRGKDVRDFVAEGGKADSLLEGAHPLKTVRTSMSENAEPKIGGISNCESLVTDEGVTFGPKHIRDIAVEIDQVTEGAIARVGPNLFVRAHDGRGVQWLAKSTDLMAYVGKRSLIPPHFERGGRFHTRDDVYSHLSQTAPAYEGVEEFPHEPPRPQVYYACDPPIPGDGTRLRELIGRFNPATGIDRDLIIAAFATVLWGGEGGTRPAFLITADTGRGSGKTSLARAVGYLFGGLVEVRPSEEISRILNRLLSPEAITKRAVLIDNVKKHRFSWADLEALITESTLSGHKLYVGEARRPNVLTWFITLNGASLSTDLAQRVIVVKVRKPPYSATWAEELRAFVEQYRAEIIADLVAFLRGERRPLMRYTRWGAWEREVLERLPTPDAAQQLILERQAEANEEQEEAALVAPALLRTDAFDEFVRDRAARLLDLISSATGKAVTGRDSDEVVAAFGGALPSVSDETSAG